MSEPLGFEASININMRPGQLVESLLQYHSPDEIMALIMAIDKGYAEYDFTVKLAKALIQSLHDDCPEEFDFDSLRPAVAGEN